jgi:hypothetical protein
MPHFKFIVFTEPVPGREDEYNDWYTNRHLADVLSVEGFVAAQRFKIADVTLNSQPASRYMSIYEIESDDPQAVLDRLVANSASGDLVMSEALDTAGAKTILYAPITERITAKKET